MVIWLTGLSGAGKTTIGKLICDLWKKNARNTVLVDGNVIRSLLGHDRRPDQYTLDNRRRNAAQIHDICAWLDLQGINVVCCTLSIFKELSCRNRETFPCYFEVYLSTPIDVVRRRDNKHIYELAFRGEMKNVVGVDIPYEVPAHPDYVFDNHVDGADLLAVAGDILAQATKHCQINTRETLTGERCRAPEGHAHA